jgi:hypothetical protein
MSQTIESLINFDENIIRDLEFQSKKLIKELEASTSLNPEDLINKSFDNKLSIFSTDINLTADEELLADILHWEEGADKLSSFINQLRSEGYQEEALEYARDKEKQIRAVATFLRANYLLKSGIESKDSFTKLKNIVEGYNLYITIVKKYWKHIQFSTQNLFQEIAFDILEEKEFKKELLEVLQERSNSGTQKSATLVKKIRNLTSKVWNFLGEKSSAKEIPDDYAVRLIEFLEIRLEFAELVLAATKKWKLQRPSAEDIEKAISTMNSWIDRFDEDEMYETLIFLEKESENDNSP